MIGVLFSFKGWTAASRTQSTYADHSVDMMGKNPKYREIRKVELAGKYVLVLPVWLERLRIPALFK